MAAGGPRADAATRHVERRALRHRPAGPVVAVRRGDRRARGRVGMAAARGPAVTSAGSGRRETGGVSLWRRLVQAVRGPSGAHSAEAERILLEADFGVGAAEQRQVWADRRRVPCITGMKDPAAVTFDAIAAARARGGGIDTVLVDTAGRLHTEERLLEELKKVVRVAARQQPGAPHESFL